MTNNDVLRRLRYAFDFGDQAMMEIFADGGLNASRAEISDWLKRDEDPAFQPCADGQLAAFLNGLIVLNRGAPEGGPAPVEQKLTNNLILRKIKIALKAIDADVISLLALGGMSVSKHELSALFRKPGHKHYRECKDQLLRNFLRGVELHYRAEN